MKKLFRRVFLGLALALCSPFAALAQLQTYNYNIGSPNCQALVGVTATVKFTQTVITNGVGGDFGFQLSAWSLQSNPNNAATMPFVGWQQYMTGVSVSPPFINPTIQTFQTVSGKWAKAWGLPGPGGLLELGQATLTPPDGKGILVLPAGYAIIAGTEFTIGLQNDNNGNVTGATFGVANVPNGLASSGSGQPASSASYPQSLSAIPGPVRQNYPAPIVGFQFEFNGGTGNILSVPPWVPVPANGLIPVGTITYTGSPMTVWSTFPDCMANPNPGSTPPAPRTAEITNSYYDPISPAQGSSQTLTQTFGIVFKEPSPINVTYPCTPGKSCCPLLPPGQFCGGCPASCGAAGCYLPQVGPGGATWKCKQ